MKAEIATQLVTDALMIAIWRRGKPDALLNHADKGSQYTREQFQRLMINKGVTCWINRSGNSWDNLAMESFFSALKSERTARKTYRSRNHARVDMSFTSNAPTYPTALDIGISQHHGLRKAS